MADSRLFVTAPARPLVAPSILSADFADLGAACRSVIDAGADLLHLDVMDGHFVPNLTMGPALCACLRAALPEAFLDVHLMVTDPEEFVAPFADAGADHLTVHIEANGDPETLAEMIHEAGMTAGLAVSPPTPVEDLLEHADPFDLLLVMSVNPGFSGQKFIEDVLEKTKRIHEQFGSAKRLQMDGGVNPSSAPACRAAGCDVLVAASAVFGRDDYTAAMTELRGPCPPVARKA